MPVPGVPLGEKKNMMHQRDDWNGKALPGT